MENSREVRRYSTMQYALLRLKYLLHRLLLLPPKIVLVGIWGLASVLFILSAYSIIADCLARGSWMVSAPKFKGVSISAVSCSSFWFARGAYRALRYMKKVPAGHILKPVAPEENQVLPMQETLVRASSAGDAPLRDELLRASQGAKEMKPEELLRASGS